MVFSLFRSKKPTKTSNDDKKRVIAEFVSGLLGIQRAMIADESGDLSGKATDDWSIGYVAGAADAVLQKNDIGPDAEGMVIMTLIYMQVFGTLQGAGFFARFMRLQEEGSSAVQQGMALGGKEMFALMADNTKAPFGWVEYVSAS